MDSKGVDITVEHAEKEEDQSQTGDLDNESCTDAKVKIDWNSEGWGSEVMSLASGEPLKVHLGLESGWAYGYSIVSGSRGWFPPTFVSMALQICVQTVGGEEISLEVDWMSCVSDLKTILWETWEIPILCQDLVVGTQIAEDTSVLASHRQPGGKSVPITMLKTLERVLNILAHKPGDLSITPLDTAIGGSRGNRAHELKSAVAALAAVARAGDAYASSELRNCLEHPSYCARAHAIEPLASLMPAGDGDVGIVNCLDDLLTNRLDYFMYYNTMVGGVAPWDLLSPLLKALVHIQPAASPLTICKWMNFLDYDRHDWKRRPQNIKHVRQQMNADKWDAIVVDALKVAVPKGDRAALKHVMDIVRISLSPHGILFLGSIASHGDHEVVTLLVNLLSQFPRSGVDGQLKLDALCLVLSALSRRGDEQVVSALLELLALGRSDGALYSAGRHGVWSTLRDISLKGDERVFAAAVKELSMLPTSGRSHLVEKAVLATIKRIACISVFDSCAVESLIQCSLGGDISLQRAALAVLASHAPTTSSILLPVMVGYLHSNDNELRCIAVQGLARVAPCGKPCAIAALLSLARSFANFDEPLEEAKRLLVQQKAQTRTPRGYLMHSDTRNKCVHNIFAVRRRLKYLVLKTLGELAVQGDDQVIAALIDALGDEDCSVQTVAVISLKNIAPPCEANAVTALLKCSSSSVRAGKEDLFEGTIMYALERLAPKHSDFAILAATGGMECSKGVCQLRRAIKLLGKVAPLGDPRAISALGAQLLHSDEGIRSMAAKIFSSLLPHHSREAIAVELNPEFYSSNDVEIDFQQ